MVYLLSINKANDFFLHLLMLTSPPKSSRVGRGKVKKNFKTIPYLLFLKFDGHFILLNRIFTRELTPLAPGEPPWSPYGHSTLLSVNTERSSSFLNNKNTLTFGSLIYNTVALVQHWSLGTCTCNRYLDQNS